MYKVQLDELVEELTELAKNKITEVKIKKVLSDFTNQNCLLYNLEAKEEIDVLIETFDVQQKFKLGPYFQVKLVK